MSATLPLKAELIKLSRLLGRPQEELTDLAELGHERLTQLRLLLSDAMFEATEEKLERIASASKIAPIPLAASIGQKVLSPVLAAGIAGLLERERAVKFARRLPSGYLADVAVAMDPRKAAPLLARIPVSQAVEVGRILVEREDYVTMGRFVGALPDEALLASVGEVSDAALLQIACVIEDRSVLDHLIDVIPEQRIANLIHAAGDHDLWADALDLITSVSPDRRGKLADLAAWQDERLLDGLVRAVHAEELFDDLLPALEAMSPPALSRIAKVGALHEPEVLTAIVRATVGSGRWESTLPIVPHLPEHARVRLAELPVLADRAVIEQIIEVTARSQRWAQALPMVSVLPDALRQTVADVLETQDPSVIDKLVAVAVATEQWGGLLPIVPMLSDGLRERVVVAASSLDKETMAAALAESSASGQLDTMLDVAADMPDESRGAVVEAIVDNAEDDDLLGTALSEEDQQARWSKLLGLADGVSEPLLERLGGKAAELRLDGVVPAIAAAAEATGRWREGLSMLAGAESALGDNVVVSAMLTPVELLRSAAEQAESLGMTGRFSGLKTVFDARRAGELTEEVRQRVLSLAGTAQATGEQAAGLLAGVAGGAAAAPKHLAGSFLSGLLGIRDQEK